MTDVSPDFSLVVVPHNTTCMSKQRFAIQMRVFLCKQRLLFR